MIKASGLRKSFGSTIAVDDLSFETEPGEIYGLLGPNGAGKTTTLSILSGLVKPDAGSVTIGNISLEGEPRKAKGLLGVVPQEVTLYEELTARENLLFWGRIYGLSGRELDDRISALLDRAGLAARARSRVQTYSGGMKRRLHLLTGLMHKPRALLLDEVTVGIDPQGRLAILDLVKEIADEGTSVLYTTHYLEEAEELCNRLSIIDFGKVLVEGTIHELIRSLGEGEVVSLTGTFEGEAIRKALEGQDQVKILSLEKGAGLLSLNLSGPEVFSLLDSLFGKLPGVEEVSIRKPSLQSLFLKLTGREIRD